MVKIASLFVLLCSWILAENITQTEIVSLQKECLHCHQIQQIPDELIYRRYLETYSTPARIKKSILSYLKKPLKDNSIMPPQFFLKFPMKEDLMIEDEKLLKNIALYLDTFDIKKKLVLSP